jgi:integrase/recombinase XerC
MSVEDSVACGQHDDPIGYFIEDLGYHGRSTRTRDAYERVLRDFEDFLADPDTIGGDRSTPPEATQRECMAWVHLLRNSHSRSTIATYASYVHRFYQYMMQAGVFESNPMALVVSEMDESIDTDPIRRDLSIREMRTFVQGIRHPLERAVVVTLLKTGMRAGELSNLDLRDLSLPGLERDELSLPSVRPELHRRPKSLFVSAEPSRGVESHGEVRTASNKRRRGTVMPVDEELERALVRWVATRPDPVSAAGPLFMSTSGKWGRRLSADMIHNIVKKRAERNGWHRSGDSAETNVTPHYFRHFFTTHLRDRTGDRGVVKYLRGDVAEDIIDTYTHDWGGRVREVYEANIYQLL